ncbi:MAG: 4Fe-4S binding protein [Pyrodictiaceae archaeon]
MLAQKPCKLKALGLNVDYTRCTRCYDCIEYCPTKALYIKDGEFKLIREKCIICLACMALCKPKAITIIPSWECSMQG